MIKEMFEAAKIDVVLGRDAEGGLATGQGGHQSSGIRAWTNSQQQSPKDEEKSIAEQCSMR